MDDDIFLPLFINSGRHVSMLFSGDQIHCPRGDKNRSDEDCGLSMRQLSVQHQEGREPTRFCAKA
jgi:hypothetical protein